MRISEAIAWRGLVRVEVRGPRGLEVVEFPNLITDAGLNYVRNLLDGTISGDTAIRYIALGSSAAAPAASDTKLGNEIFRKQVTQQTLPGTGQLRTICYIAPYEAVGQIEEIGWFAGPEATSAKDSGVLVARVLYSRNKTNLESLQITRVDTFGRV